jgi:hypothetical protein
MMSVKILGYCSIMITNICKRTPSQDVPAGTLMEALCFPWTLTQEPVHDTVCLAELFAMRGSLPKDVRQFGWSTCLVHVYPTSIHHISFAVQRYCLRICLAGWAWCILKHMLIQGTVLNMKIQHIRGLKLWYKFSLCKWKCIRWSRNSWALATVFIIDTTSKLSYFSQFA